MAHVSRFSPLRRYGKSVRLLPLMLVLALALAACGNGAEEPEDTDGGTESPAAGDGDGDTAGEGDGEVHTLRFSSIFGQEAGLQRQLDWYMDEVEERSDGRIVFERFYAAALLGAQDTLAGVAEGRAEAAYMVPAYAPADLPLWNVAFVPVEGTNSEAIALAQAEMAETNEALKSELEGAGIKMLVFNMISDLGTVAFPEPITDVAALDGLQIRALGYLANALTLRGVNAVVIEAQETYEALQRGVLDGASGFAIDVLTDQGLDEVAPWLAYMDIGQWVGAGLAINLDIFNGLPEDLQQIMVDTAEDFYPEALRILNEVEESACTTIIEAGGGVTTFPEDQVEAWRTDIGDSLWELWRADAAAQGASEEEIASVEEDYRELNAQYAADSDVTPVHEACGARTEL